MQVTALRERGEAEAIAKRLSSKGYAAYVLKPPSGTSVYRVRVGKFKTRREAEAIATLHAALDAGINVIDTAPMYGSCEAVIGTAFAGSLPAGVRITTKCQLGEPPAGTVAARLEASLDASLATMRLDHADVFFLHSNICADREVYAHGNSERARFATPWSQYVSEVVPAFEDLQRRGRIGAWGITGTGVRPEHVQTTAIT